ncbi:MAG: radical SAM protein [Candidatus Aenigmarchaeota archaeon]|nr:radical SAM protein [Candidatus Aenigmarchaeota archaeon]
MDGITRRLLKWYQGGKAPPETVQIYPTNRCNLKCIFCSLHIQDFDYKDEVSKDKWFQVTEEISKMGVEKILISGGGEPLAVPEITLGIMKIAKSHGLHGRMITNGTFWTRELIKEAVEIGWDCVVFSVDGPKPKVHDMLRGVKGAFYQTIKNIKIFRKYKEKINKNLPAIELTTVLNIHNYKEIPEMVKLAHTLGIGSINMEPVCVNNPISVRIKLKKIQREDFLHSTISQAQKLADSFGIRTNFSRLREAKFIEKTGNLRDVILQPKTDNSFLSLPCYEPWLWPKIEANGQVCPCSTAILDANIKKKSFKKIWYGKTFKQFRKRIMKGDLPDECENCVLTHLSINNEIRDKLRDTLNSRCG